MNNITLPSRFIWGQNININEGRHIEYKLNYNETAHKTYENTICAFLNSGGGYLIFGIKDNGLIEGIIGSIQKIDSIKLFVDRVHTNLIITDGSKIEFDTTNVYVEQILYNKYIIVVKCIPTINKQYQFINGNFFTRLNASNKSSNVPRFYTQTHIKDLKKKIDIEKKAKIGFFNQIILLEKTKLDYHIDIKNVSNIMKTYYTHPNNKIKKNPRINLMHILIILILILVFIHCFILFILLNTET